jgi:hypothetical protein
VDQLAAWPGFARADRGLSRRSWIDSGRDVRWAAARRGGGRFRARRRWAVVRFGGGEGKAASPSPQRAASRCSGGYQQARFVVQASCPYSGVMVGPTCSLHHTGWWAQESNEKAEK